METSKKQRSSAKVVKAYSLDASIVEAVQRLAAQDNRSASNMVETVLKEEVKKREAMSV